MTAVYYRFFWVMPITFGAAYYLTKAVSVIRKPLIRAIVSLALAAALAVLIPVNPGLTNLTLPTNVYKVNGAIPVLCDAIHADFETTQTYQNAVAKREEVTDRNSRKWLKRQAKTYPLCVFPYELEFAVRQYDPTVRLLFNRNLRLFYEGNRTTGITYDESKKRYQRRALILDAICRVYDLPLRRLIRKLIRKLTLKQKPGRDTYRVSTGFIHAQFFFS